MNGNWIAALAAFLGGAVIAVLNALMTMKKAAGQDNNQLMFLSVGRQFLNIGYLAAVYFIAKKTTVDIAWPLLGAGAGLTIPAILFAITLAKQLDQGGKNG